MVLDPYDSSNSTFAFRWPVGATLSDTVWIKTDGDGYFSGNIGIGTSISQEKLDVKGTTQTQQLNVSGVSTFSDNVSIASTNVAALTITPPSNFPVDDFIGGVSIANTENKTYPTTSDFRVTLGLNQNLEVGGTQVINSSTPGGFNFISGIRNYLKKEKATHKILKEVITME